MTQCSNCNATLKEGAKFCTNCGTPIKDKSITRTTDDTFQESKKDKPKSPSKGTKIIIGLIAVFALFFIMRSLVNNIDITRNSLSVSKALSKIEGNWHEPTGVLLGDKEAIITFRKRGDVVIGEDKNKTLFIQLYPLGNKNYNALVVLDSIDDDFDVHFYEEEEKLVFFNTLTKTSWNIKKLND